MMLEWRTFVLVGNESALLHRLRKVKIVLLGQFKFRVDSVWELIWQSRLDLAYRGHSQLVGFVPFHEYIYKLQEMEESLLVGSMAQQTFSLTQAHLRQLSGGSLSFTICQREVSGSETQLIHHCCCKGVCVSGIDPSATFLVSLKCPVCSVALCFPELRG